MPIPLHLNHLTPLLGMEELAHALTEPKVSGVIDDGQLDTVFSPVIQALRHFQAQLEPLPRAADATTYGFVMGLCKCAISYADALDGEREYQPIISTSGKPFRLSGWLLGVKTGVVLASADPSSESNIDILLQTRSYIDLVKVIPSSKKDLPSEGFLLPIPTPLYDPRPRMN